MSRIYLPAVSRHGPRKPAGLALAGGVVGHVSGGRLFPMGCDEASGRSVAALRPGSGTARACEVPVRREGAALVRSGPEPSAAAVRDARAGTVRELTT